MHFVKMHGGGNDFVMIDLPSDRSDWPALATAVCDRHFGIGADGLIVALPSSRCDLRMRIFNPDGSEAEMCGNGIRCLARYAVESGLARSQDGSITIETLAGDLRCELFEREGIVDRVRVAMGRPRLQPKDVPVRANGDGPVLHHAVDVDGQRFELACVSMGNPHAVLFTETPVDELPLARIGPLVEHHPDFPQRVNFEVVNVLDGARAHVRVWERGAGLTLACGTGACAVGVAMCLLGLSEGGVDVRLPGGDLRVEWDGESEVYLTGPVMEVFRGEWLGSAESVLATAGQGGI